MKHALMICYFAILRSVNNLRCVTCCKARSGLCIYFVLLTCVRMRSCNNGELCVVVSVCGSQSSHNLFYFTCLLALCTNLLCLDLRVTFFLLYLVQYVLTSRTQCTHTTLARFRQFCFEFLSSCCFCIFFCDFLFVILLLCQYSVVSLYVVCVCIHAVFVFWIGVFVHVWSCR